MPVFYERELFEYIDEHAHLYAYCLHQRRCAGYEVRGRESQGYARQKVWHSMIRDASQLGQI
jgi:hypothetical protein